MERIDNNCNLRPELKNGIGEFWYAQLTQHQLDVYDDLCDLFHVKEFEQASLKNRTLLISWLLPDDKRQPAIHARNEMKEHGGCKVGRSGEGKFWFAVAIWHESIDEELQRKVGNKMEIDWRPLDMIPEDYYA